MKNRIIAAALFAVTALTTACKKDLAVENPNDPTLNSLNSELGMISFATGGVYINGMRDLKYSDGVFGPYLSGALGFHEMMGDVIQCDAANAFMNQIGCPEKVTYDNATFLNNPNAPNTQRGLLTQINTNSSAGNNTLYYEWGYMYNLIKTANILLEKVDNVTYSGDAASKKAAIKAWAHWWKGYAYSRIGSIYYAGLIVNSSLNTNGNYKTSAEMITEANVQLDRAATEASAAPSATEFVNMLRRIIPTDFQAGKGFAPTPAMLQRNVNSLKARNLLVNKTNATMTAADWTAVLTLTNAGIQAGDNVFTVRTDVAANIFNSSQLLIGKTESANPGANTYKLSERWVQEFFPGDRRFTQNITQGTAYTGQGDRGNAHFTRFALKNGGTGQAGVVIMANTANAAFEQYISVTFEENELMKAEALINTGAVEAGLGVIDAIRTLQGAGLAATVGTSRTQAQAQEILRRERRIVLAFRGTSFYDARRWGYTRSVANGGGRTGAVIVGAGGAVSTNGIVDYNYIGYWHVPGNELAYNAPAAGSAPVVNPN
jgi:starch-binding outer membrane protein, SusD/RagB family